MGFMSVIALIANVCCLFVLSRHKADDLNMRSTWLCSRNDIISNTSVLLAAALVAVTQSIWPDVVVGLLITSLFLKSAVSILREACIELQQPVAQPFKLPLIKLIPFQQLCASGTCPANACHCGAS
jgi:Co/Zn/Cd efflux system component